MEIRPIISALMRSKVALILIGLQIALTLAIVCNALFIISQRVETMARPSGMNESDTFMIASVGFGSTFDTKNAFAQDLALIRGMPGVADASPMNTVPMSNGGWSEAINMAPGQKVATTGAALYFVDEHGINAYGLKLLAGRNFRADEITVRDRGSVDWPPGVIITKQLADKLYPGGDAVGKQMYLSDPDKTLANSFGVWVMKQNYGREYMGIERSTFLIDASGKVQKVWRRVKVDGHSAAVLASASSSG